MDIVTASLEPAPPCNLPAEFAASGRDAVLACGILVIDDEEPNVRLLERVLTRAGFSRIACTTDSRQAATIFQEFRPDLVLTDWLMPEFNGCAVIAQLRALIDPDDYLPIVVLTADVTTLTRKRALSAGATDFLTKPFDQTEVMLRMYNLLKARISHVLVQRQNALLEDCVSERTLQLEHALAELRNTQQQVIQQERLAALGTMASGIGHDFNNALSVIIGFGEILLLNDEQDPAREKSALGLKRILTAAKDASAIVRRLHDFYRPDEAEEHRLPVDLNELMKQAISLTEPRWGTDAMADGRTIAIEAELGLIRPISGDAAELREVLTNLIFNAVDALPEGGAITLGTHCEGETVALSIRDTGIGMSEEVRRRCLEPFFTTKGRRGTGLGLAMVFGIIQRHGGTIEIESNPGEGTVFILRFPFAGTEIETPAEEPPESIGPLRVLVVDDQPVLCQIMRDCLQKELHLVETALNGSAALEKFQASAFDLVITDHVMAGMSGEQLAVKLKEIAPQTPVILLTGYTNKGETGNRQAIGVDLVLHKPVSRNTLRRALARVNAPAPEFHGLACAAA